MTAVTEGTSSSSLRPGPRERNLPTCPVCSNSMIAAEASAFLTDELVSYLWACESCGYGLVTTHSVSPVNENIKKSDHHL